MYKVKSIITYENPIELPSCMYYMKNHNQDPHKDDFELNICDQVMRFLKNNPNKNMLDLEVRQDQLLKKLDKLYEKIKVISLSCEEQVVLNDKKNMPRPSGTVPMELVLVLSPDNLPWFLILFLKKNNDLKFTWHIHSSTPSNKILKIKSFFEKLSHFNAAKNDTKYNLRIIFKNVSATTELKISPLGLPITGNVNVLRYLCEVYPNTTTYDYKNYEVESILDTCYLLEHVSDKQKQDLYQKLFKGSGKWVYNNEFTIIDLVIFNELKQTNKIPNFVPQQWYSNCENVIL